MAKPPVINQQIQFPRNEAVSMDVEAFDELIQNQGVCLVHYRAQRCPVGMIDMYDIRRPHQDHSGCSNGFLYTKVGTVTGLFVNNAMDNKHLDMGVVNHGLAQITLPRFYDDECKGEVVIAPYDRFYINDLASMVVHWELFEYHSSGINKLHYPILEIEELIDSDNIRYGPNDYEIENGQIKWLKRPGLNSNGKGKICSVRYRYQPFWYVRYLIHEIRMGQTEDPVTGERKVHRLPYTISVAREYIFENEQSTDELPVTPNERNTKEPPRGTFGPR